MNWYLEGLKKYATFSGRARRKEYWFFSLFNLIVTLILIAVDLTTGTFSAALGMGFLDGIYTLAVVLPCLAVTVRRLHDTDRSGWWLFILLIPLIGAIALFVFLVQDSKQGQNQFGVNPKEAVI
jgi:uncharacterized membrane protein YhaH (DUF805 family)